MLWRGCAAPQKAELFVHKYHILELSYLSSLRTWLCECPSVQSILQSTERFFCVSVIYSLSRFYLFTLCSSVNRSNYIVQHEPVSFSHFCLLSFVCAVFFIIPAFICLMSLSAPAFPSFPLFLLAH